MIGLTLPAAGTEGKVCVLRSFQIVIFLLLFLFRDFQADLFPSPAEIASARHKRYWVNNNRMVRGQLVLSHKWMLFLPSHCPAQNANNTQVEFLFTRIFDWT
jgi:hypothetical protein